MEIITTYHSLNIPFYQHPRPSGKQKCSFSCLFPLFFVLLTIIRQKKGTGFSSFSSFFQKAEKNSEVSFFFLFYDLLYF